MTRLTKSFRIGLGLLAVGSFLPATGVPQAEAQTGRRAEATITVLGRPESVLGKSLVGASGESAGRIVDVLADETGQVRAVVVDFGGFLGIGSRKIAVAWPDLHFGPDGNSDIVTVEISADRLSQAPEVKPGKPVVVISARAPVIEQPETQ
jgi:hypothetical protein